MTYSKAADVNLWQDFKESFSFKPQFNVEEIFGGLPFGSVGYVCQIFVKC
jgi:hypothetical protein